MTPLCTVRRCCTLCEHGAVGQMERRIPRSDASQRNARRWLCTANMAPAPGPEPLCNRKASPPLVGADSGPPTLWKNTSFCATNGICISILRVVSRLKSPPQGAPPPEQDPGSPPPGAAFQSERFSRHCAPVFPCACERVVCSGLAPIWMSFFSTKQHKASLTKVARETKVSRCTLGSVTLAAVAWATGRQELTDAVWVGRTLNLSPTRGRWISLGSGSPRLQHIGTNPVLLYVCGSWRPTLSCCTRVVPIRRPNVPLRGLQGSTLSRCSSRGRTRRRQPEVHSRPRQRHFPTIDATSALYVKSLFITHHANKVGNAGTPDGVAVRIHRSASHIQQLPHAQ